MHEDFSISCFNHHYMILISHTTGESHRYELVDTGGYLNQLKCPLGEREKGMGASFHESEIALPVSLPEVQ